MTYTTDKKIKNIYYDCRKKAEKNDPNFKSRDKAADIIGISAVSLRDYETGVTKVIPPEVVARMSTLYNAPHLRKHYCSECPIGMAQAIEKPRADEHSLELEKVTLRLVSSFKEITHIKETLIDIAADGIIDEYEKPQLEEVLKTLDNIANHVQGLKMWAEKEFGS